MTIHISTDHTLQSIAKRIGVDISVSVYEYATRGHFASGYIETKDGKLHEYNRSYKYANTIGFAAALAKEDLRNHLHAIDAARYQ